MAWPWSSSWRAGLLACVYRATLRARLVELSFGTPVLANEMAFYWFRSRQVFGLAAILVATEILLHLPGSTAMAMALTSSAFKPDGQIPSKYTCEGEDVSPPLAWDGVPEGTKSLVLIIDDPDAPDPKAPQMVWVHWVVYNIPPDVKGLPENASNAGLPQGTELGLNDFKKTSVWRPVSADRSAPLLPQALRAGHHARSKAGDKRRNRACDERPSAGQCRTHRHVSKR